MFQPVARQSLGQQVLRSLRHYIMAHGLGPGDRLPTERELAAELGVSRNTVREALKSLEAIGALARLPKRGSILQPVDFSLLAEVAQFLLLRSPSDLEDLYIARRVLEVSILPLVARNSTEEDFQRMEMANRLMEAEIEACGLGDEGDAAFHQALLAAADNKFLVQFGAIIQQFFRDPRQEAGATESVVRRAVEDHRELIRLLRERDVTGARRLMEAHFENLVHRGVVSALVLAAAE